MNRALNKVGDVFDEVDSTKSAANNAPPQQPFVAHVEATLKAYGVDTGEPWSMTTKDPYPSSCGLRGSVIFAAARQRIRMSR
jgi:hypothetical protein